MKYDSDLQSAEDADWARSILMLGFKLMYSSDIQVRHSHILEAEYVYKKWLCRTAEGRKSAESNRFYRRLLSFIKQIMLIPYDILYGYIFLKKRYSFLTLSSFLSFFVIKKAAIFTALIFPNSCVDYKKVNLPTFLYSFENKIKKFSFQLSKKRKVNLV